jgi:CheY-like chemotaxis protein
MNNHIRISFKDDGIGMSQETLKKLFHPFFTTKEVNEGTGLGLSLSRTIILEHGGTMEVESEMGKGSIFIITLPITLPAEAELNAVIPAASADRVKPARILVVDDEEGIRKLVAAILSKNFHSVDTTGDAGEALANLDSAIYDLVLLDIRMPGMSGMELYAKILEKHPEMQGKLLFITGDTSDENARLFLESNGLPYITKPFDRATLLGKVNGLL